ncbi:MAG: DUF1697 domain-containing protein [Candidatus Nanopelagicales bacterium]
MPTWVALLRAVNLGSHNKVNMPALRAALTEVGFGDVRTYVQSGNVVLSSPARTPTKVAAGVGDVLRASFGIDTPVLVRTPRSCVRSPNGRRSPSRRPSDPRPCTSCTSMPSRTPARWRRCSAPTGAATASPRAASRS